MRKLAQRDPFKNFAVQASVTIMGAAFSRDKPLKEIVRENQRMIKKAIREMEREISNLKTQEKKLTADIKKSAKMDQMVTGQVYY